MPIITNPSAAKTVQRLGYQPSTLRPGEHLGEHPDAQNAIASAICRSAQVIDAGAPLHLCHSWECGGPSMARPREWICAPAKK